VKSEVYHVLEENTLITYERFEISDELQFYLSEGTTAKHKEDSDQVTFPENCFFKRTCFIDDSCLLKVIAFTGGLSKPRKPFTDCWKYGIWY
jgi:hypothetical protein